jgi:hypothetical protein
MRAGINFVSHGCYLNPARINPKAITILMNRVVVRGNQQNAVFISIGVVSTCNLIVPATGGFNQAYNVKNIAIYLFSQEYEHTISLIGTMYNKEQLFGPVVDGAITFSTRKEGNNFSKFSKFFLSSPRLS